MVRPNWIRLSDPILVLLLTLFWKGKVCFAMTVHVITYCSGDFEIPLPENRNS
jgi:hypothetical protein